MTTVYVTKYTLTQGIFPIDADLIEGGYAKENTDKTFNSLGLFLARGEYALTKEEAIEQAEEKRIKKLKSLDKQIKKISALNFEGMF